MFQSNFLNEFGTLSPKKPKKSKTIRALESLWLDVFVNLSFCTEGQNMILKIQGTDGPGVFYTEYLVFPRFYRGNIAFDKHENLRTGAYFQNFYNLITLITSH